MDKPDTEAGSFRVMNPPVYTWECHLFGIDDYILRAVKPPFILHRWFQRLILGNRWEKIK